MVVLAIPVITAKLTKFIIMGISGKYISVHLLLLALIADLIFKIN